MNDLLNPEDALKETAPAAQHGRVWQFAGQDLERMSFAHRAAYFRIARGEISRLEETYLLLYILTKKGREVDKVRFEDDASDFRMAAAEWGEKTLATTAQREEAFEIVRDIWRDAEAADNVEPTPEKESCRPKE